MGSYVRGYSGKSLSLDLCSYQFKTFFTGSTKRINLNGRELDDSDFLPEEEFRDSSAHLDFEDNLWAHLYFSQNPRKIR